MTACECSAVDLPIGVLTQWEPDPIEPGGIYHAAELCGPSPFR